MKRPFRVTAVCWFAILWGVLTLYPKFFALLNADAFESLRATLELLNEHALVPLPFYVHVGYSLLASVALVLSGWFMLKGRRWARVLFLAWCASSLLISLATYGFAVGLLIRFLTYSLLFWLLVYGASTQFFAFCDEHAELP